MKFKTKTTKMQEKGIYEGYVFAFLPTKVLCLKDVRYYYVWLQKYYTITPLSIPSIFRNRGEYKNYLQDPKSI